MPLFSHAWCNDLPGLADCHAALEESEVISQLPGRVRGALWLMLDELGSNLINHLEVGRHSARLVVDWSEGDGGEGFEGEELVATLEDDGVPFNPWDVPPPPMPTDPDEAAKLEVGGRGIEMVRRLADGTRYRREEGKNLVSIVLRCAEGSQV